MQAAPWMCRYVYSYTVDDWRSDIYTMFIHCFLQITDDLKVVATTREQRQKIRAHELLERKELLAQVKECTPSSLLASLLPP